MDHAVLVKVRGLADDGLPGIATLDRSTFLALLPALAGHPRVTFARKSPATIHTTPFRPDPELPADAILLAGGSGAWMLQEGGFHLLEAEQTVTPTLLASPTFARDCRFALALEGSLNHLTARLDVVYGDRRFTVEAAPRRSSTPRDQPAERQALERLHAASFTGPDHAGQLVLKGEPKILAFFARDLPRLEKEWEVTVGTRFAHVTRDIERIQPRFEIRPRGKIGSISNTNSQLPEANDFLPPKFSDSSNRAKTRPSSRIARSQCLIPACLMSFRRCSTTAIRSSSSLGSTASPDAMRRISMEWQASRGRTGWRSRVVGMGRSHRNKPPGGRLRSWRAQGHPPSLSN